MAHWRCRDCDTTIDGDEAARRFADVMGRDPMRLTTVVGWVARFLDIDGESRRALTAATQGLRFWRSDQGLVRVEALSPGACPACGGGRMITARGAAMGRTFFSSHSVM